ncbi:hypothetical protein BpHYR1_045735 [Brachionus plicatilis]|uniref:Uncharacterized protein n=1 Tax=Brachionus plicatilis TaxID=10195 RepID=A0A3M7PWY5_BRAPC|nr:hypothetical protein BpHYR1_045735 [Brachionus plicatilis]
MSNSLNSNLTNFGVIIDPSEEIRSKPEKTHFFLFIFEILSLKEQQLFKGFAIFGILGVKNFSLPPSENVFFGFSVAYISNFESKM